MNEVPTSFDFGGALRPDYIVKCSYGNDSIALIQFLHEYNQKHPMGKVVVLYNDTGWGAAWWPARVENAEKNLVVKYGFIPARTKATPWRKLLRERNAWPDKMRRFCTQDLKIEPTQNWLCQHDPEGKSELICGVRREESTARARWPEYADSDTTNEGRPQWSPLVFHTAAMRDELIVRAGWKPLPHRSRECRCIMANATDLSTYSEQDIKDIEQEERILGAANKNREFTNKFMFHPHRMASHPHGIREVVEWAKKEMVKKEARKKPMKDPLGPGGGCDSGYCTG
jgi:hypothetical protein